MFTPPSLHMPAPQNLIALQFDAKGWHFVVVFAACICGQFEGGLATG